MADNFIANAGSGGDTFAADDVSGVKYPFSKIDIGADGLSKPLNSTNPMPTTDNGTVFLFSTNNSSTTQLTAGSTFTGVIETALDQPSISLLLTSDQDTIITIRQFIDLAGTRAAPNIVFPVAAGVGFARSMPLNGNYVQVLAQNVGASTTTTFNINTAYGNMLPADSSGALPITELPLVITGQAAQTATVNNILTTTAGTAPIDVSGYRSASVQVVSTGTAGTFIFEQSNDGTNWVALPVFNAALVTGVPITAAITASASTIIYSFAIRSVYLRLRIATTITGGSIRAYTRLSTDSWTASAQLVASNTAANLNATVAGTVTANQGTLVTPSASILNSAATTNGTVAKGSAGTIYGFTVNNNGAGVAYFKLHNSTTVTVGTTAVSAWFKVPAGDSININYGATGLRHATGICYSITGAVGDTDTTAVAAGQVKVNLSYI